MSKIIVNEIESKNTTTTPVGVNCDINIVTGKTVKINSSTVLSATQVLGKTMPTGTVVGHNDEQTLYSKTLAGFTLSNDITINAAVDIDLPTNASAISFDSANKVGILEIDSTNGSEKVKMSSDLEITGNLTVKGTTSTISSTTITVADKNLELGKVTSPTDVTADGGGITIKGTTDKTFNWIDATDAWTSSEHLDLASGKSYYINGTVVLSSTQVLGITRQTNALANDGTVSISTLFGSQVSGSYRFFDLNDPRISGTIFLKHNGPSSDPDVRVDSNSSTVSITINTASSLNVYIASNVVTFQNKTGSAVSLVVYKEV
jgi:hypothetical protein